MPRPGVHEVESLSRMPDCELAEGAPDVRGWDVTSPTSARLGVVKDLLVDLTSLRVRYLDVVLGVDKAAPRRVLLPIGKVWINDALDEVVVPASPALDALPDYEPSRFSRELESRVLAAFGDHVAADFYAGPAFDDNRAGAARAAPTNCGRRETDAGAAACSDNPTADAELEAANGVGLPVIPEAAD